METINVLEVIRQGQIGGGESHLLDLIAGLDSSIRPVVLSFTDGPMIDALTRSGTKCYVIHTTRPFDLRVLKQVAEIIRKEQIQIVHAHGSRAASNVALTARQLHIPLLYTVHGWSFHQDQPPLIKKLRALSEKLICALCHEVICVSESNRITGQETFGLRKATVIENGINLKRFHPEGTFQDIRQEFGFTDEDFIVGFISRITLQKAPVDFVKSIAIAHRQEPRIKALLIGEGDMEAETQAAIRTYGIENCIRCAPFRNDVPDILYTIDVFCLPSLWEGLSIALLEAMAMKKAIVVTPTDGTKEVITHRVSGLIAQFNQPEELSDCYLTYFRQPELKEQYGNRAMKMIRQRFDSQRVSDQVRDIYKQTIKKGRGAL